MTDTPALEALRRLVEAALTWADINRRYHEWLNDGGTLFDFPAAHEGDIAVRALVDNTDAYRAADPDGTLLTRLAAEAEAGRAVREMDEAAPDGWYLWRGNGEWRVAFYPDSKGHGAGPTLQAAAVAALQDEATDGR